MNSDGRMDIHEFSIAMKLIKMKLQGHPLPSALPPSMKQSPLPLPPQTAFGECPSTPKAAFISDLCIKFASATSLSLRGKFSPRQLSKNVFISLMPQPHVDTS